MGRPALVEERGLPAVLHYFALFAEREDPAANFLEAFGQTEAQFEDRLQRVVRLWPLSACSCSSRATTER